MSNIKPEPFAFNFDRFKSGSQTIVIHFNEQVNARCGRFHSYKKIENEIIPLEIERAKKHDEQPLFDSFDALINKIGLVRYNDKESQELLLCNNFEQQIAGAWEVSLLGNTDGLATALNKLSRGEKADPVSGLIVRNGDKFAWLPFSIDIARHTFCERQSTPISLSRGNETPAPEVIGVDKGTHRNSLKSHYMDSPINQARTKASNPNDLSEVWGLLMANAKSEVPWSPIGGEQNNANYIGCISEKPFSREALRKYLKRKPRTN